MNKKAQVTAAELYVLLARELKRRRSRACAACHLSLPYRVDRLNGAAANWELALPPDCGGECRGIMEELVVEFSDEYELRADPA